MALVVAQEAVVVEAAEVAGEGVTAGQKPLLFQQESALVDSPLYLRVHLLQR
jgi:hypothetical protein